MTAKKKNISLRTKLIASFGIVSLMGVAAVSMLFVQLEALDVDVGLLKTDAIERIDTLSVVRNGVLMAWVAHERWKQPTLSPELYASQFGVIQTSITDARRALEAYAQFSKSAEEERSYAVANENITALFAIDEQIAERAREHQGRPDAAVTVASACLTSGRPAIIGGTMKALDDLRGYVDVRSQEIIDHADASTARAYIVGIGAIFFVLVAGLGFGMILTHSITKMVKQIAKVILRDAGEIVNGTKELATGSQSLAAASSEQAASVEEISATLEEVSAMIKQNADNASQADKLTAETSDSVDHTEGLMKRSLSASEEIAQASNETFKIIKSIDEIAFQTNLLSLNAAVEAARAGEAGAGFAVVADEVRGLSMRSAEASKRTAELIEQTMTRVSEGMDIFTETGKSIEIIVGKMHKIRDLIREVAAASGEQAKGVEQISKGVLEMEKVIQQNAANSEESAASTEEMFSQAAEMSEAVNAFAHYIYGTDANITKELGSSKVYYEYD
jgi:hypothetical protein